MTEHKSPFLTGIPVPLDTDPVPVIDSNKLIPTIAHIIDRLGSYTMEDDIIGRFYWVDDDSEHATLWVSYDGTVNVNLTEVDSYCASHADYYYSIIGR